ncbi:MAG: hypothetical protein ACMXYG_07670 [Candidatus Woesearchaeota archaeon]
MDIYKVTTEADCEGRSMETLGYATGDKVDIENYYEDRKSYNLRLTKIEVIHITPSMIPERAKLKIEKKDLEARLKELDRLLQR